MWRTRASRRIDGWNDPGCIPGFGLDGGLLIDGYDTTEDELTDDELDALEDARLDAELDEELDAEEDAELDEYAADLTDADIAHALSLAEQFLASLHDTS